METKSQECEQNKQEIQFGRFHRANLQNTSRYHGEFFSHSTLTATKHARIYEFITKCISGTCSKYDGGIDFEIPRLKCVFFSNEEMTQNPGITGSQETKRKEMNTILFTVDHFKLSHRDALLQLDCRKNGQLEKKDLVSFLQSSKPAFLGAGHIRLLLVSPGEWNVDIEGWTLLSRLKFNQTPFRIAFVTVNIHQQLLLKQLSRINSNIRSFSSKKTALGWLTNPETE